MRTLGVIPARYGSTRFPGKPLAKIAGKPLVQRVVERAQQAHTLREVVVATDDTRIAEAVRGICRVELTSPDHPSGTDRVAEVVRRIECEAAINLQGDEPLINPAVIDVVVQALSRWEMSTAATLIRSAEDLADPNVVKVVVNRQGRALYFSRYPIPYLRNASEGPAEEQMAAFPFLQHLGIYGFRRATLLQLVELPVARLERAEKLEQLRALEQGIDIGVVRVDYQAVGVDVPEDIQRVERLWSRLD